MWRGDTKVFDKSMADKAVIKKDKALSEPFLMGGGKGTIGVMALPVQYNPNLFLAHIVGQGHFKVTTNTDMVNLMVAEEDTTICQSCKSEPALFDKSSNKRIPVGKKCFLKKMMTVAKKSFQTSSVA